MKEKNLAKEIEALLFYKNEPISAKELSRLLEVSETDIVDTIKDLSNSLSSRGIVLVSNNAVYSLATSPDVSATIEKVVKDELNRDLSAASLETLSVVAYKGMVSRKEIEYIRGVNSSYSIRALLMRGLIEREASRLDERIYLYKPTNDLLHHLGIASLEELPEWENIKTEIKKSEETDSTGEPEASTEE